MNFTPFGTTFSGSIPTVTTAKFAHQVGSGGGQVVGLLSADDSGVTYLRPVDANGFTLNLASQQASGNSSENTPQIITLPISVPPSKPGDLPQQQTLQIQVVNPGSGSGAGGEKYHTVPISLQPFQHGGATVLTVAYSNPHQEQGDPLQLQLQSGEVEQVEQVSQQSSSNNNNNNNNNASSNEGGENTSQQNTLHADEMGLSDVKQISEEAQEGNPQAYPVAVVTHLPPDIILRADETITGDKEDESSKEKASIKREDESINNGSGASMTSGWQTLPVSGSTVADYLSRLPASSLPLSLHHFLKFSAETIKREAAIESSPLGPDPENTPTDEGEDHSANQSLSEDVKSGKKKKKYKKKPPKPRRPRPGQVHIAVALDGTTLYCCPECNMAYPDKEMLEQHLVAHKIERRFICDICGAGLKRKEHLERHKLGHNPERPYICTVCCKGFKRKEHLNLHFVIHSGEKSEVCPECGKGFHRKDHLRKHARSHIAKKVKEETLVVQTGQVEDHHLAEAAALQVPTSENSATPIILQQAQPH